MWDWAANDTYGSFDDAMTMQMNISKKHVNSWRWLERVWGLLPCSVTWSISPSKIVVCSLLENAIVKTNGAGNNCSAIPVSTIRQLDQMVRSRVPRASEWSVYIRPVEKVATTPSFLLGGICRFRKTGSGKMKRYRSDMRLKAAKRSSILLVRLHLLDFQLSPGQGTHRKR